MPKVYISIGSNIERETHIRAGVSALETRYGELAISTVYESRAVGFEGDDFYNLVVGFETGEPVETVEAYLEEVEQANGRVRGQAKFSPRTLDLDLLLYGDLITRREGLTLPRPEIETYAFVLLPLAELAGDLRHPESDQTYKAMWDAFDQSEQVLTAIEFSFE